MFEVPSVPKLLALSGTNTVIIVVSLFAILIIVGYASRPNEESLLQRLKDLGLPVVTGEGSDVNISEALEIGSQLVRLLPLTNIILSLFCQ